MFCTNSVYFLINNVTGKFANLTLQLNVQIVLTGACRNDKGYAAYQQYIAWLWQSQDAPDLYEEQSKGLEDQLQVSFITQT